MKEYKLKIISTFISMTLNSDSVFYSRKIINKYVTINKEVNTYKNKKKKNIKSNIIYKI